MPRLRCRRFMAAVVGVSSPLSASARRSSRSFSFPSSGSSGVRPDLSSMASANGVAMPQTRAIHQRSVRGTSKTHTHPKTKTYIADCQLTHEVASRTTAVPRAPAPRLTEVPEDRLSAPDRGSSKPAPRRTGSCLQPPPSVCPRTSFRRCSIPVTSLYLLRLAYRAYVPGGPICFTIRYRCPLPRTRVASSEVPDKLALSRRRRS